jgi:hypothetical protein
LTKVSRASYSGPAQHTLRLTDVGESSALSTLSYITKILASGPSSVRSNSTAPKRCFFYGVAMSSLPQHTKGASLTGWRCPHCHSTRRVLFLFVRKAVKRCWASPKCQPTKNLHRGYIGARSDDGRLNEDIDTPSRASQARKQPRRRTILG